MPCSCRQKEDISPSNSESTGQVGDQVRLTTEQVRMLGITTARAESIKQDAFVVFQGVVVPQSDRQASVFAPFSGNLIAGESGFPVLGQSVEQGEVLGIVEQPTDTTETQLAAQRLQALEAAIDQARQELDRFNRELERNRKLFDDGLIPKKQVQQAEKDAQSAQNRLLELQKSKESSEKAASVDSGPLRVELRAPIRGAVFAVHVSPGEPVDTSKAILEIADVDVVGVEIRVLEEYLPLVRQVTRVEVIAPDDAQAVYNGQLVSASTQPEGSGRTSNALYSVQNRNGALLIGAQVEVHLPSLMDQTSRPACQIPAEAAIPVGETTVVFVETQPQLYEKRLIDPGPVHDGIIPIVKGLVPGDVVVVSGASSLLNRAK
jgi:RND family efflux transporter MFP subunit